jgi:hypothetical protein
MTYNVFVKRGIFLLGLACCAMAQAQEVTLIGSVSGLFNNNSSTIQGLSYTGSAFNVTTSGGFYALGSNASSNNFNNLGSFTLLGNPATYTGDTFTLDVTFSGPAGIQGSNLATYSALLTGKVTQNDQGGIQIDFPSQTDSFTFANSSATGQFTLTVNPVAITPGHSDPITGFGTGQQQAVPEPASMACMLTGLVGAAIRKRRKK